ncbi:MAG: triose-phosphate isomerase [Candidatus Omnitrophota bacterium]
MRIPIIAGNWKMNKTPNEASEFASALLRELSNEEGVEIALCPAYPALLAVNSVIAGSRIKLGAQDVHWEHSGAYTGEVSVSMLKDSGCSYVIIGHSERRQYFGETNESVNKKLKAALKGGLFPIMCVGETPAQRKDNKTFDVVKDHIDAGLAGIREQDMEKIVIAYEPVWAIGTGVNATPDEAQEVHRYIRELLTKSYGDKIAQSIRIQYGGSVKPDNVKGLMSQPDIDGALVGGASLDVKSFAEIVRGAKK